MFNNSYWSRYNVIRKIESLTNFKNDSKRYYYYFYDFMTYVCEQTYDDRIKRNLTGGISQVSFI